MTGSGEKRWQVNERPENLWVPSRRVLVMGAGGVAMAGTLAACGGSSPSPSGNESTADAGTPKQGGNFRLGVTGGGSKDIMDGQNIVTKPDQARLMTAFETLLTFDDDYQLKTDGLAESVEADNPTQYTIKIRKGIDFQNGKPFTADDVIYSLQRIGTQANGLTGFAATATMDIKNIKKIDKYTIKLPLLSADSTVPQTLASYTFGMVPVGYEAYKGDPSTQIGTGCYKLKSFTPGQESMHERNPNYWRGDGSPWFDTVTIKQMDESKRLPERDGPPGPHDDDRGRLGRGLPRPGQRRVADARPLARGHRWHPRARRRHPAGDRRDALCLLQPRLDGPRLGARTRDRPDVPGRARRGVADHRRGATGGGRPRRAGRGRRRGDGRSGLGRDRTGLGPDRLAPGGRHVGRRAGGRPCLGDASSRPEQPFLRPGRLPSTITTHAGFGYHWWPRHRRRLAGDGRRHARPVRLRRPAPPYRRRQDVGVALRGPLVGPPVSRPVLPRAAGHRRGIGAP